MFTSVMGSVDPKYSQVSRLVAIQNWMENALKVLFKEHFLLAEFWWVVDGRPLTTNGKLQVVLEGKFYAFSSAK